MRVLKPLIVLLGIVATEPALAVPPDDAPAAVTVLRGSSAPVERPSVTPEPAPLAYREVVYLPAYSTPCTIWLCRFAHLVIALPSRRRQPAGNAVNLGLSARRNNSSLGGAPRDC